MVKSVVQLPLFLGGLIVSIFIMLNSEPMILSRFASNGYKIPDHLLNMHIINPIYANITVGFGIFLLASIFTIRTIISIFKL